MTTLANLLFLANDDEGLLQWVCNLFLWLWNALNTSGPEIYAINLVALFLTMVVSIILTVVMVRFREKNFLDVAILLREIAIATLLARLFIATFYQQPSQVWSTLIITFLGASMVTILIALFKEQIMTEAEITDELARKGRHYRG